MTENKKTPHNKEEHKPPTGMADGYSLGLNFAVSIAVGGLIGYGLDLIFNTKPLLMLVFFILGFGSGILQIWKFLNKPTK